MTVHHRKPTYAAAFGVVASAAVGFALGLISLGRAVAACLAALPGFGIVQLWRQGLPCGQDVQPRSAPMSRPMIERSVWGALVLVIVSATLPLRASDADTVFSHYRTLTLGDSVPAVIEALQARLADVKVVQERPSLVQELTWRRQRYVSGVTVMADPLDELVLTFHLGRLARIAVTYDRNRIEGLTDADLTDAFTGVYGAPMLPSTASHGSGVTPRPAGDLGLWSDGETLVTLRRDGYPRQVRLTIAMLDADAAMREALTDGAELAASEAPGKELARQTADAAALLERAERIRRDNKASFKP
jgi:hypothetical protein